MAANCMSEVCLGPETPAKRVQLKPKFVYSRRRFREKKFSHILLLASLPHSQDGLFSPSTLDPPTSDVASPSSADVAYPPELAPPAIPHPPTDYHHPAHEQSEVKKREESNKNRSGLENDSNGVDTDTKKRKNDGIDSNKRALKTPKKKIHRPKVVGEGKLKRPREPKTPMPKTPKPKTPKRAYTKKSSKRVGVENVRRGLNFDDVAEEKLLGDRSIVVVVRDLVLDLKPLSVTKRKRSKQRKRTSSFVKSRDLHGCEAKTHDAASDQNPIAGNFKTIGYSEETLKICNTVKPVLIDLNLPYVENETSIAGQSTGKNDNSTIVPYVTVAVDQTQQGQLCVVKKSRKELMLELYKDDIKAWKKEAKRISYGNADGEAPDEKLKSERATFRDRIRVFTSCMHIILGDRTFSEWKGSVIDSVIGVFLTQNVSDILSSSAFIDLRARFPVKSSSSCEDGPVGFKLLDIEDFVPNSSQEDSASSESCLTDEQRLEEVVKMMDTLTMDGKRKSPRSSSTEPLSSEKKESTVKEVNSEEKTDWEEVRKRYQRQEKRSNQHKDSVDWEAIRQAPVDEIAETIKKRGQHNNIAKRIKEFLDRVVELHKTLDLEWLRHVPADLVQKYLLEFKGLGLKSVECIRLLGIQNVAFPVDTNVGRIAIRLGWVPLEPLPEEVQIHLLQQYPMMDSIQKYLWPRLCTLDQRQLYELHYHLITFGKVFCTKRKPNCNECPMKAECRHYASHYASARKSLPAATPRNKNQSSWPAEVVIHSLPPPPPLEIEHFEPTTQFEPKTCEPIIEMPQSPEPERGKLVEREVEEYYVSEEDDDETIPTIRLNEEEPRFSRAMVPLAPEVGSYPIPKLKSVSRLRTKHLVYELPDSHPILAGLDQRERDDRCPYLLAIWTSDETTSSSQPSGNPCCTIEFGKTTCIKETCGSCTGFREHNQNTVRGTILIPCRTAMCGSFPLNGTYFQVNEVFADHESSHNPIDVPTQSLWNLRRRITYFGTSTTSIFKGLSIDEITINFWTGFMCNRAFDRKTGITKPLALRLHMSVAHQQAGTRKKKEKKME